MALILRLIVAINSLICLGDAVVASNGGSSTAASTGRPTTYPVNYIDQPIDHFPISDRYNPHKSATFKQRYYFDSTYYKPGGPVFLYIGGETSGPSRFSNLQIAIIQILMSAMSGLGVILENRYYGQSFPFSTSTTDNLRFLTTEQTIADNAFLAQHAVFPGIAEDLRAPGTPWILYGGSLAGAQTAFSLVEYGGNSTSKILWGGIASSAPVEPAPLYPEWYAVVQKYCPSDCISRLNALVDKMDFIVSRGNRAPVQQLKDLFGLSSLNDDDFAMTIAFPIGGPFNYPANTWQELGPGI
jgi:hypothetical protein